MMQYIATFFTHFDAVRFARDLNQLGILAKARPVPRSVSSSCGTAVEFSAEDLPGSPLLDEVDRIFALEGTAYRLVYEAPQS